MRRPASGPPRSKTHDSLIATLLALGALIFSASLVFNFVNRCFRRIWQPTEFKADNVGEAMRKTVMAKVVDRLVSILMALAISVTLTVSVLINTLVPLVQSLLSAIPLVGDLAGWAVAPVSTLGLSTLTFLLVFKYLPPVPQRWGNVWQ